jgi:uncharacterized protein (TIGR03792 family)
MVIEWLKFKVSPLFREKFIQKDAEVWTPLLAKCPGFLSKEVWINPDAEDEIIILVRWETRQQWKEVPQEVIEATDKEFAKQMPEIEYQMSEAFEYQVRKFPQVF